MLQPARIFLGKRRAIAVARRILDAVFSFIVSILWSQPTRHALCRLDRSDQQARRAEDG
ncbi:hypothetical protein LC55x_1146 [Lysobacter capsici]|nr:hypothetical protein LC55x_1146 [Lysobacter capsici]